MKKYVGFFLALVCIIGMTTLVQASSEVHTGVIPTSGGNRNVTWVEIDLNAGYEIRALSAQDSFGRASATLTEFVAAANVDAAAHSVIFPVNFFITATHEIVGGIVSQGRTVSAAPQPWLNWGIGFTDCNRMSLFDGRINGNYIYGEAWYDPRLPYITAFNAYPHLVRDGRRLPIQDMPGATLEWQNMRARRSFMGQRADGIFIVGTVDGTNIPELQDIAMYLNLVMATNIDGGASASLWRNGTYLLRPGRQLASVMVITGGREAPAPVPTPVPPRPTGARVLRFEIGSTVYTDNGVSHTLNAAPFMEAGRTMVPLRVIGEAFGATGLALDNGVVSFVLDGRTITMPIGRPIPGNMGTPIIIAGTTFVPLGYIIEEMGAIARWDGAARAVYIYFD